MEQFKKLFGSLSIKQRLAILIATIVVGSGVYSLSRWQTERDFQPLYRGMSAEDAGAVLQKLKEKSIEFRLADNGSTVLAPSGQVAELRLELAGAGLPKSGRAGFELFDKTNFGVTDFAEHINYRRALEGELERSILSLTEVEQARVHVTFPKDSVFLESRQAAKASVLIRLRSGMQLSAANTVAITHLVSSAVEGLAPEAVSVLDTRGNLLSRPRKAAGADGGEPSEATLEFRQRLERDLVAKIHTTLDPLLGEDKFRANVLLECDFTSGEQSEEIFDPARSVMLTSQKSEDVSNSGASAGVPGTASSLPRPTSSPSGSGTGMSRRTENITYQSSRTMKRTKVPQGLVRRLSAAVLLDQEVQWQGKQRIFITPPPERLKSIRDLIAAAVGFSAERGDQLIVESMPFEMTRNIEPPTDPVASPKVTPAPAVNWLEEAKRNPKILIVPGSIAAGVLIVVCLGLFFVMRRAKKNRVPATTTPALAAGPEVASAALAQLEKLSAELAKREIESGPPSKALESTAKKVESLTLQLREATVKDSTALAGVVRDWLGDGNA